MTIEFTCPHCDKSLKTSEDKAGRQAKCPGCGELINVPDVAESLDGILTVEAEEVPDPHSDQLPLADGPSGATKACPICGETIKAAATRCRFCKEYLDGSEHSRERLGARREMRPFPPGEVMSEAWRLFVEQMGLLIGALLVVGLLSFSGIAISFVPLAMAGAFMDQKNEVAAIGCGILGSILMLLAMAFTIYLQAGYAILQIKVAREQPAQISDLFSGGKFWGRMLLNSLLFGLIVGLGTVACVIPGILLAVMYFPFAYVIVDEDLPGIECLGRAKELTDGNWGSIFLVFIVGWFATSAGAAACYVGMLFAIPFVNMMYVVEYDRMTCQTSIKPLEDAIEPA